MSTTQKSGLQQAHESKEPNALPVETIAVKQWHAVIAEGAEGFFQ